MEAAIDEAEAVVAELKKHVEADATNADVELDLAYERELGELLSYDGAVTGCEGEVTVGGCATLSDHRFKIQLEEDRKAGIEQVSGSGVQPGWKVWSLMESEEDSSDEEYRFETGLLNSSVCSIS